jgi:hypothetical protein
MESKGWVERFSGTYIPTTIMMVDYSKEKLESFAFSSAQLTLDKQELI